MEMWWRFRGVKMWVWKYSFSERPVTRSMRVPAQSMPTWREEGC